MSELVGSDGKTWPETFDANIWSAEFVKRFPAVQRDDAIGWFANAIMRGYDEYHHRNCNEAKEKLAKFGASFISDLTRKNWKIKGQYLNRKLHKRAIEFDLMTSDGYASNTKPGVKEAVEELTK